MFDSDELVVKIDSVQFDRTRLNIKPSPVVCCNQILRKQIVNKDFSKCMQNNELDKRDAIIIWFYFGLS